MHGTPRHGLQYRMSVEEMNSSKGSSLSGSSSPLAIFDLMIFMRFFLYVVKPRSVHVETSGLVGSAQFTGGTPRSVPFL